MGLIRLLLVGLIGGGAAYLYKNREARETALTFGRDLLDVSREMVPAKYQEVAAKFGVASPTPAPQRLNDLGLVMPDEDAGNQPGGPIEVAR